MNLTYGAVMCMVCNNYVYDKEVEDICRALQQKSARLLGKYYSQFLILLQPLNAVYFEI